MVMQAPIIPLASSVVYPNSILWSEDNLLAVAAGQLIFIINPSCPSRGRGIIKLDKDVPFSLGMVHRDDPFTACLLTSCLSRDIQPCARSISWSPLGLASNRCLLAVCTTEGRAKIFHAPLEEPYMEWTEMLDISDYLCAYYARCNFMGSSTNTLDCNQDNSLQSWALHGNSYAESYFQQNSKMLQQSSNVMQLSNPCFGLAVSPGNLIISLVLTLDPKQLDPMYEAKSQKAAIEFLWISGQPLDVSDRNNSLECNRDDMLDLSERELLFWKTSLLQSLKQYENTNKQLVIWDVLFALMFLKQHNPSFVDCLLSRWLTGWLSNSYSDATVQWTLSCLCGSVSRLDIRKLHLLNIMCRRLMFADSAGIGQNEIRCANDIIDHSQTGTSLWLELAVRVEREIRERLVAFSFKAFHTVAAACPTGYLTDVWLPYGIAQMEQWVSDNVMLVSSELKLLTSKISETTDRNRSFDGYKREESCTICSALVPFESPEVAICCPVNPNQDSAKLRRLDNCSPSIRPCRATRKSHELKRCSATMQICSISSLWHCSCCQTSTDKLLPEEFFATSVSPLDVNFKFSVPLLERPEAMLSILWGAAATHVWVLGVRNHSVSFIPEGRMFCLTIRKAT